VEAKLLIKFGVEAVCERGVFLVVTHFALTLLDSSRRWSAGGSEPSSTRSTLSDMFSMWVVSE